MCLSGGVRQITTGIRLCSSSSSILSTSPMDIQYNRLVTTLFLQVPSCAQPGSSLTPILFLSFSFSVYLLHSLSIKPSLNQTQKGGRRLRIHCSIINNTL